MLHFTTPLLLLCLHHLHADLTVAAGAHSRSIAMAHLDGGMVKHLLPGVVEGGGGGAVFLQLYRLQLQLSYTDHLFGSSILTAGLVVAGSCPVRFFLHLTRRGSEGRGNREGGNTKLLTCRAFFHISINGWERGMHAPSFFLISSSFRLLSASAVLYVALVRSSCSSRSLMVEPESVRSSR